MKKQVTVYVPTSLFHSSCSFDELLGLSWSLYALKFLNSKIFSTYLPNLLRIWFSDDVIEINGQTMSVIYDPPHLIKGLRNNFLTKNILFEKKISKWNDIVEVYKTDCSHAQMRLLHKLNDEHVIPEKIKKMKVSMHW